MTLRSIGGDSQVPLDHAAMLGLSEIVSALIDGGSQLRLPAAAAPGREADVASPCRKMISPGLSSVFDDEVHVQPRAGLSCADSVQIIPCKLWIQGRRAGVAWEIVDK